MGDVEGSPEGAIVGVADGCDETVGVLDGRTLIDCSDEGAEDGIADGTTERLGAIDTLG